ncbi:hypothetical protein I4U23_010893 [Adineta vaga]|nr:hypothetical protein I4U23_010893 [Adineta vaga]
MITNFKCISIIPNVNNFFRILILDKIISKFVGETVTFKIIRQGKELILTSLFDCLPSLVPSHAHDKRPEYLIYAGIVFTVLTRFYLHTWAIEDWFETAPKHLINLADNGQLQELDQEIVVIDRILADDVNYGIESKVQYAVLKCVNGVQIKNIKHLAKIIDKIQNNKDKNFIRFETESKDFIVIHCEEAKQAEERILKQNSIAYARSENLR